MCVVIFIMSLFQRHRGFLQSLLREANAKRRNVMLDLANKNQLNALSEMVLNVMKQNVPIQPKTIEKLKRYKNVLQELRLRQTSLKRRRQQLKKQTGRDSGKVCTNVTKHVVSSKTPTGLSSRGCRRGARTTET